MRHAILRQHAAHVLAQGVNAVEFAVSRAGIAGRQPAQAARNEIAEQRRADAIDMGVGKIGVVSRHQRGVGMRAAIIDRGPRQDPRALRFDDLRVVLFQHGAHRRSAGDEAIIRAAAHLFGADLHPNVPAGFDHAILRPGHDLQQPVIGLRQHIIALLPQIGADATTACGGITLRKVANRAPGVAEFGCNHHVSSSRRL